jgi:hypothetical protein
VFEGRWGGRASVLSFLVCWQTQVPEMMGCLQLRACACIGSTKCAVGKSFEVCMVDSCDQKSLLPAFWIRLSCFFIASRFFALSSSRWLKRSHILSNWSLNTLVKTKLYEKLKLSIKMISLFKQVRSIGNEIPHAEIRENGDRQKRDRALYVSDLLKQRDLIVFLSFDAKL